MLKPLLVALAAAGVVGLGACTQETRVEDDSSAERAIENASNDLERAGEEAAHDIEHAGDEAADAVNDATDGNPNTNP